MAGVDYKIAHDLCAKHGRKDGRRFLNFALSVQPIARALGLDLTCVKRSGSLGKLIAIYPTARLLVQVRGHSFAVVNGVVRDTWEQKEGRHVRHAWLVNEKTEQANSLPTVEQALTVGQA